ncbi:MAG: hypothetical protein ACFCBV_07215 [Phycisphaerales bacterium]
MIAIERFHLAHGRLPSSLDELGDLLADSLAVDPVTLQPWDYESTGGTYHLASRPLRGWEDDASEQDPLSGIIIVDNGQ